MRRAWAWPLALGVLLAAVGIIAVSTIRDATPTTPDAQSAAIAAELRCPDCQGLSVAESRTAAAQAIRREIDAQLAAGRTPDEVRDSFVERYGDSILLRPAAALAWLVPLVALVGALTVVATWMLRRGGPAAAPQPVDEATRHRLDEETEALDA